MIMLEKNNTFLLSLLIASYSLIIVKVFISGPILVNDTFEYIAWSEEFLREPINFFINPGSYELVQPQLFYTFTTIIFSAFIYFSPDNWVNYFLIFNLLSVGLIFFNLYLFLKKFLISGYALILVPILFLTGDSLVWPAYIMMDVFYASCVISVINFFILFNKNKWVLILAILFLVLLKPQSLAFILAAAFIFLISKDEVLKYFRQYTGNCIFILIVMFTLLFEFVFSDFFLNTFRSEALNLLGKWIEEGMIVKERFDGYQKSNSFALSNSWIFINRLICFFQPWVEDFSLLHNLMFFILNASFIIASSFFIFHKRIDITENIFKTLLTIFLIILSGAIFHSFTFIDFDWRYRFPYVAPMALFCGLMLDQIIKNIIRKKLTASGP